jgi:hypothetical protein
MPQIAFMTAPAGISPWVTYLERAMSSLRASATIEMRRVRPRSEPTRWRNQWLRALSGRYLTHIQASSIIVVRSRGLPACEMPQFVVDAATLPWAGSQARIGCQLREPACACAGALSKSGESATQERELRWLEHRISDAADIIHSDDVIMHINGDTGD